MGFTVKEYYSFGILGCGWLGRAVASKLRSLNKSSWGSSRSEASWPAIEDAGATPVLFDSSQPSDIQSEWPSCDTLLICCPPSAGMPTFERAAAFARNHTKWTVLISSTSVYPDEGRSMIEDDAIRRLSPHSGACLLDIEQCFESSRTSILRAGGLFGPNRHPGKFLRGKPLARPQDAVNMVHQDDVLRAILFSAENQLEGPHNLVAPQHITRAAFYHAAGATEPPKDNNSEPQGRKVLADKLQGRGFEFLHPNPAMPLKNEGAKNQSP